MSPSLACMLCGAAGSRELFLSILTIFLLMFAGTAIMLLASVLNGDWSDRDAKNRPLEAEREALREEAARRG